MKDNISVNGIGFGGVLTLILITLKLTGFIQWGWLWVFAPIWFPAVVVLVISLVILFSIK